MFDLFAVGFHIVSVLGTLFACALTVVSILGLLTIIYWALAAPLE